MLAAQALRPETKKGVRMNSRTPFWSRSGKTRAKMPYHYTQGRVITFQFYRFRFHFRALDGLCFPPGKGTNAIRSVFGAALHSHAPAAFRRLFESGSGRPTLASGLANWP